MEPIELNGKTFCSNCGLTVGAASPHDSAANITPFSPTDQPISAYKDTDEEEITTAETGSPIKDEIKADLGLPNTETEESIIDNGLNQENTPTTETAIVKDPVKLTVNSDRQEEEESETQQELNPVKNVTTVAPEGSIPSVEQEELTSKILSSNSSESEEADSLVHKIDIPSESDFEDEENVYSDESPTREEETIENKIEQVDTLGASGILLDILSENYQSEERVKEIKTLKTAEELVDKLDFESHPDEVETHAGALKNRPENPIENLEISSPLDELEISAPEQTTGEQTKTTTIGSKSSKSKETIETTVETEGSEDFDKDEPTDDNELYKLPHELKERAEKQTKKDVKKIEKIEEKLATLEDATPTDVDINSQEYDPDTLAPLEEPGDVTSKPDEKETKNNTDIKQEIVKSFLKEKLENNHSNKAKPKKKSKKAKGEVSLKWPVVLLIILAVLLTMAGGVYVYSLSVSSAEEIYQTDQNVSDYGFTLLVPTDIPADFTLTDTSYNEASNSIFMVYDNDKIDTESLLYTQQKASDPEAIREEIIKDNAGIEMTTTTSAGKSYYVFENGNIVWTNDDFVFTIKSEGFKLSTDLLITMAQSVR